MFFFSQADICDPNAICEDRTPDNADQTTHTCKCRANFVGDGIRCATIEVNECLLQSNVCAENAECINTFFGFECECNPGFLGNGFICGGLLPNIDTKTKTLKKL